MTDNEKRDRQGSLLTWLRTAGIDDIHQFRQKICWRRRKRLFEILGLEFRLQAAGRGNRLKAELQTSIAVRPWASQTGSKESLAFSGSNMSLVTSTPTRFNKREFKWTTVALVLALSLATGCKPKASESNSTKPSEKPKIGYVLHGLNDFTQVIKKGAEDAALAENVSVNVVGPAGFSTADAIAMFEGMTQKHVGGLVVVPMPGEVWVTPIRQATEAGIPVLTANVTSPKSTATAWFGQDEFGSGMILAGELRKFLAAQNRNGGRIIVGMCAPGVGVLVERYQGFKKGMAGTKYQISEPFDVNTENTANYGAWENLAGANPDMVAIVGLCSMDLPNLARLKVRTKGQWLVAGYDLGRETLDAVKAGTIQVVVGQHPYLQGYLPVVALARHLRDKQPLPPGWIDIGTEVVTKENVESIYGRETDEKKQREWYSDYVAKHFTDLKAVAKPLPQPKP